MTCSCDRHRGHCQPTRRLDDEGGAPAPEGDNGDPGGGNCCAHRCEGREAHLDGGLHAQVVVHLDERAAVMCGDPAHQGEHDRDQRETAPVSA